MYQIDLSGTTGLIFGVANKRSIAWTIAQALHTAGARLAFTYEGERIEAMVRQLVEPLAGALVIPCDVTDDSQIEAVYRTVAEEFGHLNYLIHSVAYARQEDLEGAFLDTSRDGFHIALDVSAYSLIPLVRHATPLMERAGGGSVVALTYMASEKVFPNYNVMGSAKSALEHAIRQLAYELGDKNIRVNGISAGPLKTLAARGIAGFTDMLHAHRERAPLKRNINHDEVAKTALYLCSDMASGVTGEIIHVDAGYHIMGI
ncbi:MAG: enoyl-ACP reductase [Candidatus Bipolaricaulia bacterium]